MGHVQAVGETWEKFPELKFLALKRMYKYMVRSSLNPSASNSSSSLLLCESAQILTAMHTFDRRIMMLCQ